MLHALPQHDKNATLFARQFIRIFLEIRRKHHRIYRYSAFFAKGTVKQNTVILKNDVIKITGEKDNVYFLILSSFSQYSGIFPFLYLQALKRLLGFI